MGRSTQIITNGILKGYECEHGHLHACAADASNCDPDDQKKLTTEAAKQAEAQRLRQIKDDPGFKKAVQCAKTLGASEVDAEGVVLRNGIQLVIDAAVAVRALKIPTPKPSDPPKV